MILRKSNGRYAPKSDDRSKDIVAVMLCSLLVLGIASYAHAGADKYGDADDRHAKRDITNVVAEQPRGIRPDDHGTCLRSGSSTWCAPSPEELVEGFRLAFGGKQEKTIQKEKIDKPILLEVSAYTSRTQETDDSPCIAANGKDICKLYAQGIMTCATNDYPLGTTLEVEGLGRCIVMDRMNKRYTGKGNLDWYMGYETSKALAFGRKTLEAKIIN